MGLAFGQLALDKEFGPITMEDRLEGILKEALMEEVGRAPAAMDPCWFLPLRSVTGAVPLDGWRAAALS
jgi:hypothetical protein